MAAASIDVTGIVATYAHLLITIYGRSDFAAISTQSWMRFNGDTAANYDYQFLQGAAATASAGETFAGIACQVGIVPANTAGANLFGSAEVFIPHYAGSSNNKQVVSISANKGGTSSTNLLCHVFGGSWRSSAAINRVTLFSGSGNYVAGTRVTIHALGA